MTIVATGDMGMNDANRRLAGILAADVVGYSAMVGKDEPGTLARVRTLRTDLIEPLAAAHAGLLFKTTGDGFLAAFASAVQALRCAIAIQERLDSEPDGLRLRIGVHQGEVVAEGEDLLGDGVIIAARLEPLAEPGGICISARVREDAAGKMALEVDDLGVPELKNIAVKVQVFRVRLGMPERPALPLPDKPSIAVLPFQNMSGDPEQEYFADGVVDDIITSLSRSGWLFVIARNSSFAYKGTSPDVRRVGRELGVRYVLGGGVRRSSKRIRITCQLIEAATGGHVWADRFDAEMEDIFELQDHITEAVVGAIEPSLKRAEIARATAKPTERLDAYDLYLRAWTYYNESRREASDTAIALLQRALEIDPTYMRAKALLANAYAARVAEQLSVAGEREKGIALAREVLGSDTDDPEVLCRAGFTFSQLAGDFPAAFTAVNRALRLHPNSVQVLSRLAWVHCQANDPEPAVALFERAMRLSPLDPSMGGLLAGLGTAHLMMHRNAEALPLLQRAVQEAPKFAGAHRPLIFALVRLGRLEEARAAAARLMEIRPDYRAAPVSAARFSRAFQEDRLQAELAAGIPPGTTTSGA
jgi:adenylate cyclase